MEIKQWQTTSEPESQRIPRPRETGPCHTLSIDLEEGRNKALRHKAIKWQHRYKGAKNRPAVTHGPRRAGRLHKNRYPATHSTTDENNERKTKYVRQYIRKTMKKGKETATGECTVGYTTRSGRGRWNLGHVGERTTRNCSHEWNQEANTIKVVVKAWRKRSKDGNVPQGVDPSTLETDQSRRKAAEGEKLLKPCDPTGELIILPAPAHAGGMNIRIDKRKTCREKAEDGIGTPRSHC